MVNGKYEYGAEGSEVHAAIFLGYDLNPDGTVKGIFVLDQYDLKQAGIKPGGEQPASISYIPVNDPKISQFYGVKKGG
jgi:hypothetical protein